MSYLSANVHTWTHHLCGSYNDSLCDKQVGLAVCVLTRFDPRLMDLYGKSPIHIEDL